MADDENFRLKFFITKLDDGLTTVVGLFTFSPIMSRLAKIIILLIFYLSLIVGETKNCFYIYFIRTIIYFHSEKKEEKIP